MRACANSCRSGDTTVVERADRAQRAKKLDFGKHGAYHRVRIQHWKGAAVTEPLTYALSGSVATVTMDDGKANSLSPRMLAELNGALDRAVADKATLLITGRDQRFSGGFDLATLKQGGMPAHDMFLAGFRLSERLLSFPTPVVVACNGHALAMGAFLLLSADVRVGAAGPFKIGANEVAIGLTMPYFGVEISRQRLTPAHFTRAVMTAEIYTPEAAVAAGFLDHVVPVAELLPTAQKIALALSQLDMPAHAATKLRARESTLLALRVAIDSDDLDLRSLPAR
jgi:enoyl-CoA hydratase